MTLINNCIVNNHLKWSIELNEEAELYKLVEKVVYYFNFDVTVWSSNSFTQNEHGFWNAVISINVDSISYCYMFSYNHILKILYGGPCSHKKILPSFEHTSLSRLNNPSLFNIFETGLLKNIKNLIV
jgi:hypothetical protein